MVARIGEAEFQMFEALGLPARDQVAYLLSAGGSAASLLEGLAHQPLSVLHKARLFWGAMQAGVPSDVVERARQAARVHPATVAACASESGVQLERPSAEDGAFRIHIGRLGTLRITSPTARSLPDGLASPGTLILEGLTRLRRLAPFPETRDLEVEECALSSLDLRATPLRRLVLRRCPLLRSVRTGPIGTLVIDDCPSLTHLCLGGPVGGDVRLVSCPWLEHFTVGGALGGNLALKDLPRLARLPDGLHVAGHLDLQRVGVRFFPAKWQSDGPVQVDACPELESLGRPAAPLLALELEGCPGVRRFGAGFTVLGDLKITDCAGFTLLDDAIAVGGTLTVQDCRGLAAFKTSFRPPSRLVLRNLPHLENLPARETPYVKLELSSLPHVHKIPATLKVDGVLKVQFCTPVVHALERRWTRDD